MLGDNLGTFLFLDLGNWSKGAREVNLRFTDMLLTVIISAVVGYCIYYYFKEKQRKAVNALKHQQDEMLAVPISNQLFILKNMSLSGQTKRKYETLVANWQELTNFRFPEIETVLYAAEQFAEKMKMMQSQRTIEQGAELIAAASIQVNDLHQALTELLAVEEKNREQVELLHQRYNEARKSVMNHSFDYGPAIETLEKNIQYMELNFTKYNELMVNGDYLEARDMLGTIEADMESLEDILVRIPALYEKIRDDLEDSLADLREGYTKMVESRFNFDGVEVLERIDEIQEKLDEAKNEIKNADLSQANNLIDKAERDINTLYEVMETEQQSKQYVVKHMAQLRLKIEETVEQSRYAGLEVDRLAQSYILHESEVDQVAELTEQVRAEYNRFKEMSQEMEGSSVIYTQLESRVKKVRKRIEEISEQITIIYDRISNLQSRERAAKSRLDDYEADLRNIKRRVEKSHLPGLSDNFYAQFYRVTDQIEYIAKQLNRVRIDMDEIEILEEDLAKDLDKLEILASEIVDSAMLTEYMIQQSNRYRYDFPDVDAAIKEAQYLFHREFKYVEALAVIEKSLRRVDQEAPTQVRRMYHQEKSRGL